MSYIRQPILLLLFCISTGLYAQTFKDCHDCPEMEVIPAGSFDMGKNYNQPGSGNEALTPRLWVTFKSFAISKNLVTQGEWKVLMGSNPSLFQELKPGDRRMVNGMIVNIICGDNCPVENVSWHDAKDYISKLNAKTGKNYRLPSEAQWEYACKAGNSDDRFCGGNTYSKPFKLDDLQFNKSKIVQYVENATNTTTKKPNIWGLYDMLGNLAEWTEDCWNFNYKGAPTDGSAWLSGTSNCSERVVRGSSSAAKRSSQNASLTELNKILIGFRVVRDN